MMERIELWFEHVPHGKRTECPLSKGTVELQPSEILFGQASRGEPIKSSLNVIQFTPQDLAKCA